MWVDGVECSMTIDSNTLGTNSIRILANMFIGAIQYAQYITAEIAQVALWTRVIQDAEITDLTTNPYMLEGAISGPNDNSLLYYDSGDGKWKATLNPSIETLQTSYSSTDPVSTVRSIYSGLTTTISATNTENYISLYTVGSYEIDAGVSAGNGFGFDINNYRAASTVGADRGTLTNLYGATIFYGHNLTDYASNPETTNTYGLYLNAAYYSGKIPSNSSVRVATPTTYSTPSNWAAYTSYELGDRVKPTSSPTFYYVCTTAGTSDASEPSWPGTSTEGETPATVSDGSVTWTELLIPSITTNYGIRISNQDVGASSTSYGLYFSSMTARTNNYGIYFDSTNASQSNGICWNGDTNLYRGGADTLKTDDKFRVYYDITNSASSVNTIEQITVNTITSANSGNYNGAVFSERLKISANTTASGTVSALALYSYRGASASLLDYGTLTTQTCSALYFGHVATDYAANPLTTTCYGIRTNPYYRTGTITSNYGINLTGPSALSTPSDWAATTAYTLGQYCKPTSSPTFYYVCTTAGTSGGTEPSWPGTSTAGQTPATVEDGTVTWTELLIPSITTNYGMRVQNQDVGASSTAYGIYMASMTSRTNNYGIYFQAGTAGQCDGICWAGDTNLYRSAANILKTDDKFYAATGITTNSTNTWKFAGYTTTAPSSTGYVSVDIDGTTYKLICSNV
jgi:hypothetical protein